MSYTFQESVGLARVRRYVGQVIGGLEARAATAPLAAPFVALRERIDATRAAREAGDDKVLAATARLRVDDADWDEALGRVSSRAYELADKKADKDPYATLFGKVTAKRARAFGAVKAQVVGESVVRDGRRLESAEAMADVLDALAAATTRLEASKAAWDEADDALFEPRRAKKKLIANLNEQIAIAEAGILMAFPGRGDLVNAVLTPWFERRRARGAGADDDGADVPVLDAEEDDDEGPGGGVAP